MERELSSPGCAVDTAINGTRATLAMEVGAAVTSLTASATETQPQLQCGGTSDFTQPPAPPLIPQPFCLTRGFCGGTRHPRKSLFSCILLQHPKQVASSLTYLQQALSFCISKWIQSPFMYISEFLKTLIILLTFALQNSHFSVILSFVHILFQTRNFRF